MNRRAFLYCSSYVYNKPSEKGFLIRFVLYNRNMHTRKQNEHTAQLLSLYASRQKQYEFCCEKNVCNIEEVNGDVYIWLRNNDNKYFILYSVALLKVSCIRDF